MAFSEGSRFLGTKKSGFRDKLPNTKDYMTFRRLDLLLCEWLGQKRKLPPNGKRNPNPNYLDRQPSMNLWTVLFLYYITLYISYNMFLTSLKVELSKDKSKINSY